jgi:N-acetylglutamate synthase-like GNAT family acetyltransferase
VNQASPRSHTIRTATPEDHSAVSRLFESSYSLLLRPCYNSPLLEAALPLMTRANPILLASGTFFVAEDTNGVIVGCGGWTRKRPGKGDVEPRLGHIRHFATHPDHSRRGIGRSIYDTCARQARTAGISRFECFASLNAVGFYAALGFEEIEDVDVELSDRIKLPGVLMRRSI